MSDAPQFNDAESPLLRLYLRKGTKGKRLIDAEQFAAGERLRADYERSMMAPRVTMAYQQNIGGTRRQSGNTIEHISDTALVMRDRVHSAFAEVGPELSGILWNVVCMAGGLEHAERVLALPPRSGKAVLAMALDRLARHYGLKARPRQHGIGTWHVEDYRPAIPIAAPPAHRT
jgi:hypothetical protein